MKGTVKWFNVEKGYGFIMGEDSKEYFVYYKFLAEDAVIEEGDNVDFKTMETERGIQARDVKKV